MLNTIGNQPYRYLWECVLDDNLACLQTAQIGRFDFV